MRRYWPGKLPVWAVTGDRTTDEDDEKEEQQQTTRKRKFIGGDDSRLRRLAEARADEKKKKNNDVRSFHRAEILSTTSPEVQPIVDDDDDGEVDDEEDVLKEKRNKLREKILRFQRQQEENERVPSFFEEEEDESEYDTTDFEVDSDLVMLQKKPVYVPKSEWDTIADRERIEAKVRALQSMMENRAEARRCETKQILLSFIQQEEDTTLCHHNNDLLDTIIVDYDFNGKEEEQEEYEAWKIRETLRMRRDKVAATLDRYTEEHMEELAKEKPMSPNPLRRKSKQKWRFMQKYYHKGAFFQSYTDDPSVAGAGTDDIYTRDFSAPTGDDKMNRTLLPKIMQVKHFGRIGRIICCCFDIHQITKPNIGPKSNIVPAKIGLQK
ncbi:Microfibrillar-associated protein [Thalictrum thalictroides]|uniref:Microfibrillar-associated protein n=1 Tax=Thalictrum thalictroides TaxID=46969 RepID=A0A7J6V2F7_THATH|nr:Microfibrillar-associated protein [Thalictrum thalictroides]